MNAGAWFRWSFWLLVLTLWTAALLSPLPIQVGQQVLPEGTHFSASKSLHLGTYLALVLLTTTLPASPRARLWLLALLVVHGPLTEWGQCHVPMRTGTFADAGIDLVGVTLGAILARRWFWPRREPKSTREDAPDDAAPADRQRAA